MTMLLSMYVQLRNVALRYEYSCVPVKLSILVKRCLSVSFEATRVSSVKTTSDHDSIALDVVSKPGQ
jgi:hypothetical protein